MASEDSSARAEESRQRGNELYKQGNLTGGELNALNYSIHLRGLADIEYRYQPKLHIKRQPR